MKVAIVLHQDKATGLQGYPQELGANPPMTMDGLMKILSIIPALKALGPFLAMFVSRMCRACDAVSVLAMSFDMDFCSINGLGQAGNLDSDGTVIPYPGHESDGPAEWQRDGLDALEEIWDIMDDDRDSTVLAVSHRPIVGALIAAATGVFDPEGINAVVQDKSWTKNGYVVFNYDDGVLTLVD